MSDEDDRRARALARKDWPIARFALGEEPEDDLSGLTPAERVAMVWRLTRDAWASAGTPWPTYARADAPGKVVRRHGTRT